MRIIKKTNIDIHVLVPSGESTIINKEDEWILKEFPSWTCGAVNKYIYVARTIKTKYSSLREKVLLHRVIVCPTGRFEIDHIDRNRLNNRRSNLRMCTRSQNLANKTAKKGILFKGVHDTRKYHSRSLSNPFAAMNFI